MLAPPCRPTWSINGPTPANQVPDYGRGEEVEITIAVITGAHRGHLGAIPAAGPTMRRSAPMQCWRRPTPSRSRTSPAGTRVPLHWRSRDPSPEALRRPSASSTSARSRPASYIAAVGKIHGHRRHPRLPHGLLGDLNACRHGRKAIGNLAGRKPGAEPCANCSNPSARISLRKPLLRPWPATRPACGC